MKFVTFCFFFIILSAKFSQAADPQLFCMMDESGESTVFICHDEKTKISSRKIVDPIEVLSFIDHMENEGVRIVSGEVFLERTAARSITDFYASPYIEPKCEDSEYPSYYKYKEFNALPASDPTIQRLTALAKAIHKAGVCDLAVRKEDFNAIDVRNKDDLLQQFLCITNSESLFGSQNIGMGGRGPWGIHPMHNQKAGTKAFVDGRSEILRTNGICYPSKAIVRDSAGNEIKKNSLYLKWDVVLDNARCALKVYQTPGALGGLSAWGTGSEWGSNRHCSRKTRERLNFKKYLGTLACCSEACKNEVKKAI